MAEVTAEVTELLQAAVAFRVGSSPLAGRDEVERRRLDEGEQPVPWLRRELVEGRPRDERAQLEAAVKPHADDRPERLDASDDPLDPVARGKAGA